MSKYRTVVVNLSIGGRPVRIEQDVPDKGAVLEDIVPLLQDLSQLSQQVAVDHLSKGKSISCGAGCTACCYQVVPIARFEARHVRAIVEAMPEPRRSEFRKRFADALKRFEEAGVTE